jgi:integrase
MTKAADTVIRSQADCESAPEAFQDDGTPKTKTYTLGNGLLLQVTPSKKAPDGTYGISRSWLFRYSMDGRETRIGLGSISELSLEAARHEVYDKQKLIKQGIDPKTQRDKEAADRERQRKVRKATTKTFRACAEAYIAANEDTWTPLYTAQWKDTLERLAYPAIGDMPVADIERALVKRVLAPLWDAKKTTQGSVLRARIAKVLGWAMAEGFRPEGLNPAEWRNNLEHSFARPKTAVSHPALDTAQIPAFMAELRKDPGAAAQALAFTVLTASRTKEVRGATWAEINLAERTWTVPAERMKMRDNQGRGDHIVPLSDAAVAILMAMKGDKEPAPTKHVFGGRFGADLGTSTLLRVQERVCDALGIEHRTVHGFRSSFSDWAGDETDTPEEVREFSLAHVKKGVAKAYRRKTAIEKRRLLMQAWADYCGGVGPDNVIPLKRSA